MARTTITNTATVPNAGVAGSPSAIDIANGMQLALSQPEKTILLITNTDAAAHIVTIPAGDPVLAGGGTYPSMTFSIPAAGSLYIGPFESARCTQKDGSMQLNFVTGHAGTVTAIVMPRGF